MKHKIYNFIFWAIKTLYLFLFIYLASANAAAMFVQKAQSMMD